MHITSNDRPAFPHPLCLRSRSLDARLPFRRSHAAAAWAWSGPHLPPPSHALTLKAHTGCVNSLALSPCSRLLLSGSDDTHLRLWPVYDLAPSTRTPSIATFTGATRNVFHALFASPTHIVSSGADGIVRCHDIHRNSPPCLPILTFADEHADVVQRLATLDERVFLSASDDGSVRVWDVRQPSKSVGVLQFTIPVSHVDVLNANEFVVSGEGGLLARFDFRMCFGGSGPGGSSRKRKRDSGGEGARSWRRWAWRVLREDGPDPIMEYEMSDNNIASLALSPDNRHLVALSQYGLPHLYSIHYTSPLAIFSHAIPPPDPFHADAFHYSGFSNIATHKVPAFLPTGDHIVCGSDDFGLYTWRIPPLLLSTAYPSIHQAPVQVTSASRVQWGHMSLPNRVLPHPDLPYLFSCGVEHSVRVSAFGHGAADAAVSDSETLPARGPRPLLSHQVCLGAFRNAVQGMIAGDEDDDRAERRTIAYFDMVVRQAARTHARRSQGSGSDSDGDSSGESGESDEENEAGGEAELMGERWSDMEDDDEQGG